LIIEEATSDRMGAAAAKVPPGDFFLIFLGAWGTKIDGI